MDDAPSFFPVAVGILGDAPSLRGPSGDHAKPERPLIFSNGRYVTGNPDVSGTAAKHLAKAMARVHPQQREALLLAVIDHAQDALGIICKGRRT